MPTPHRLWHIPTTSTASFRDRKPSPTGDQTIVRSRSPRRLCPTDFKSLLLLINIALLLALFNQIPITRSTPASRRFKTDVNILSRFNFKKEHLLEARVKSQNKVTLARKESVLTRQTRELKLWKLFSKSEISSANPETNSVSLIVSITPGDTKRPYRLFSVHDKKKRMQLGVKIYPEHVLISYKQQDRKFVLRTSSSDVGTTSSRRRTSTFSLLFTDGAVTLYSLCGASVQSHAFPALRVIEALLHSRRKGVTMTLGRHRSSNNAFQRTICQITFHRGDTAARNYCKYIKRKCQAEYIFRKKLRKVAMVNTPGLKQSEDHSAILPTDLPQIEPTSFNRSKTVEFPIVEIANSEDGLIQSGFYPVTSQGESAYFDSDIGEHTGKVGTNLLDSKRGLGSAPVVEKLTLTNSANNIRKSNFSHFYFAINRTMPSESPDINEDVRWAPRNRYDVITEIRPSGNSANQSLAANEREFNNNAATVLENTAVIYNNTQVLPESDERTVEIPSLSVPSVHDSPEQYIALELQRPEYISASMGYMESIVREQRDFPDGFTAQSQNGEENEIVGLQPISSLSPTRFPDDVTSITTISQRETTNTIKGTTNISASTITHDAVFNTVPTNVIFQHFQPTFEAVSTIHDNNDTTVTSHVTVNSVVSTLPTPSHNTTVIYFNVTDVDASHENTDILPTNSSSTRLLVTAEKNEEGRKVIKTETITETSSDDKGKLLTITVGKISYVMPASTLTYFLCTNVKSDENDERNEDLKLASMLFCGKVGPKGEPGPTGQPGPPGRRGRMGRDGPQGPYGRFGMPGLPGDPGPEGIKGHPGMHGLKGPKGVKGDKGYTGTKGDQGMEGIPGEDGISGSPGLPGYPGEPGRGGRAGPPGFPGRQGEPGTNGSPGIVGPSGEIGITGLPGLPGLPGVKGEIGLAGKPGTRGLRGQPGDDGKRGIPGIDGLPGIQGKTGPQGLRGSRGEIGPPGPRGKVGSSDIKGYPGHQGPPGQKGDKGTRGLPGQSGKRGHKGETGETGLPGAPGLAGRRGRNGTQGDSGARGFTGAIGPIGPPGHDGQRGISLPGQKGYPGERGAPGLDGLKGLPGSQGDDGKPGAPGPSRKRGLPGPLGKIGLKGKQGDPGDIGRPGPVGLKGSLGVYGMRGKTGFVGLKGDRGEQGKIGPTGEKGPMGHEGLRGLSGPVGAPGPQGIVGVTGSPGPHGEMGIGGPAGPQGARGEPGADGKKGPVGDAGLEGAQGTEGERGNTGVLGPKGIPGPTGISGPDGEKGPVGYKGEPGLTGVPGDTGEQGPPGLDGLEGTTGSPGAIGPRGEKGEVGPVGINGREGVPGPTGPPGDEGEGGEHGKKGEVGEPGVDGEDGPSGDVGDPGQPGPEGTRGFQGPLGKHMKAGTTGEKGLRGPKGERGKPGPQGIPGEPGENGLLGLPGPKGERGERGSPGEVGEKGEVGLEGLTGFDGPTGLPGVQGAKGQPGEKGIEGEAGKKGPKGPVGDTGPPGYPGIRGVEGEPGFKGPKGPRGPEGPNGETGEPGHAGRRGKRGAPGETGEPGIPGEKGASGQIGETGIPGDVGFPGPTGTAGRKGARGPVGPRGVAGRDGSVGMTGDVGEWGPPGRIGDHGPDGFVGLPGRTGEKGLPGIQGPQGVPGPRGVRGLEGYRGDPGVPGSKGAEGEKGDQGEKGDRGLMGLKGVKGLEGRLGDPGLHGPPGPDGYRGTDGQSGRPGPEGLEGQKGERGQSGKRGSIGDVGIPGPLGRPGRPGAPGPPGPDRYIVIDDIGSVLIGDGRFPVVDDRTLNDESVTIVEVEEDSPDDEATFRDDEYDLGDLGREIQYSMQTLRDSIHSRIRESGWTKQNPATTCQDIELSHSKSNANQKLLKDGIYWIDPNEGCTADAFQVECYFTWTTMSCLPSKVFDPDSNNDIQDNAPDMEEYFRPIVFRSRERQNQQASPPPDHSFHLSLPYIEKSQRTFLHMRSTVAEQTITIKCKGYNLWSNENPEEQESGTFTPRDVRFQSWNGKKLKPKVIDRDPNDPSAEIIIPRVSKGVIVVVLVEDNCNTQNDSWRGAVMQVTSFFADQLPVTHIVWPKSLDPNKVYVNPGGVCFR